MDKYDHLRGCLVGLALGDAIGTTLEFEPRDTYEPIDDLVGGGPFDLEPGQWTDDTSMALCLAASLIKSEGFDPRDQMQRYQRWQNDGYFSSAGNCFDIGATVESALMTFEITGDPFSGPTDEWSAGNGSIMRLAPIPMFYHADHEKAVACSKESSRTTHGAPESVAACQLLGSILWQAINGADKRALLEVPCIMLKKLNIELPEKIEVVGEGSYRDKQRDEIRGTGYVVDCLEAALWCFHRTESYRDAVLLAANLGEDADTTAAVCGQIAGAHYGLKAIPKEWLIRLYNYETIVQMADELGGGLGQR